jgi:hypothetical protein
MICTKNRRKSCVKKPVPQAKTDQLELFEEWLQVRDPESSHYPSIFGLTSMFLPVKDRKKGDTTTWGKKGGEFYYAGDFTIQRFGPGLSTYDEDTLIAILQLSSERMLVGDEADVRERYLPGLPQTKTDLSFFNASLRNSYYVGTISPYRINKYFGRETSGAGLAACLESMLRLQQTSLTISKKRSSKIADTHFFSLIRDEQESSSVTVVIDPIMAKLMQDFVVMDLNLRRKLTPVGKGVYRYLEASGVKTIPILDLMERIGTTLSVSDFNRALLGRRPTAKNPGTQGELKVLQDSGWLRSYEIVGTGRSRPFVLKIEKP